LENRLRRLKIGIGIFFLELSPGQKLKKEMNVEGSKRDGINS
jgi:hypothetical protein